MNEEANTLQRLAEAVEHIDRLLTAQTPEQAIELTAELLLAVSGASGVVVYLKGPDGLTEQWAAGQLEGGEEDRAELAKAAIEEGAPQVEGTTTAIPITAGMVRSVLVAQEGTAVEGELATLLSVLGARGLEIAALRSASVKQRQLRVGLGRYIEPTVGYAVQTGKLDGSIEPEERPVSILSFEVEGLSDEVDLVGPERLMPVLHQYFGTLVDTITEHEGTFLGHNLDGAIAVFGAPVSSDETTAADLAAAAALQLLERLKEMTERWGVEGLPLHIRARAGVSSGTAMVGAYGPEDRPLFSVLGPLVGLAHQLVEHGEPGDLIIDSSTRSLLAEFLTTKSVGAVEVRGLDYPIFAYCAHLATSGPA